MRRILWYEKIKSIRNARTNTFLFITFLHISHFWYFHSVEITTCENITFTLWIVFYGSFDRTFYHLALTLFFFTWIISLLMKYAHTLSHREVTVFDKSFCTIVSRVSICYVQKLGLINEVREIHVRCTCIFGKFGITLNNGIRIETWLHNFSYDNERVL